jgi:hypothetical protein
MPALYGTDGADGALGADGADPPLDDPPPPLDDPPVGPLYACPGAQPSDL